MINSHILFDDINNAKFSQWAPRIEVFEKTFPYVLKEIVGLLEEKSKKYRRPQSSYTVTINATEYRHRYVGSMALNFDPYVSIHTFTRSFISDLRLTLECYGYVVKEILIEDIIYFEISC